MIAPGAFLYLRPQLAVEADLTRLVRVLLQELKRQVLENVVLTVPTDFDAGLGAGMQLAQIAALPGLALMRPELAENRFFSTNERPQISLSEGQFECGDAAVLHRNESLATLSRNSPRRLAFWSTREHNPAMKSSLQIGLAATTRLLVDEGRCIGFMGVEGMVYATPRMVSDVEYACRDLILAHLDEGEDSVGTHVSIDHLAATPLGLEVAIDVKLVELDRRRVTFEFSVRDPVEECGRGRHVRFINDKIKSFERIRAKRVKAGL